MNRGLRDEREPWEDLGEESSGQRPVSAMVWKRNGVGVFEEQRRPMCRAVHGSERQRSKDEAAGSEGLAVTLGAVGGYGGFQAREGLAH